MEEHYQILKANHPIYGRKVLVDQVYKGLTKATPDNIFIVGPKYIGKTAVVRELMGKLKKVPIIYQCIVYWDLRYNTPASDDQFYIQLSQILSKEFQTIEALKKAIDVSAPDLLGQFSDVLDCLASDGQRILLVLDRFDALTRSVNITKKLWDTLANLVQKSSLRILAVSRTRMKERLASPMSFSSVFWDRFCEPHIQIGSIKTDDWTDYLKPLGDRGIALETGARTELENWTGGIPILLSAILMEFADSTLDNTTISKKQIDQAADTVYEKYAEHLQELWEQCSTDEQIILARSSREGSIQLSELSKDAKYWLPLKGYIAINNTAVRSNCRLMDKLAMANGLSVSNLELALGKEDLYKKNIKNVLQIRFRYANITDEILKDLIRATIEQVEKPDVAIQHVRGIFDRAFSLIFAKEAPTGSIPEPWIRYWQHKGITEYFKSIPESRGQKVSLLNQLTDGKLTRVKRSTAILLGNMLAVGNYGQHQEDAHLNLNTSEVPFDFMVSVCFGLIEMASQLSADLSK